MSARKTRASGWAMLVGLLFVPFTTAVYGATLAKLWEWFIADTFHVLALSTAQAIGVSLTVEFITYQSDARHDEDVDGAWVAEKILGGLLRCALVLLTGAVVKAFI